MKGCIDKTSLGNNGSKENLIKYAERNKSEPTLIVFRGKLTKNGYTQNPDRNLIMKGWLNKLYLQC